jgi:hypothetical protein
VNRGSEDEAIRTRGQFMSFSCVAPDFFRFIGIALVALLLASLGIYADEKDFHRAIFRQKFQFTVRPSLSSNRET